eukprot:869380-Prorocentrum_minimum.AAC.7
MGIIIILDRLSLTMRVLLPPTPLGTPRGARLVRSPAWRGRATSSGNIIIRNSYPLGILFRVRNLGILFSELFFIPTQGLRARFSAENPNP